MKKGNLNKRSNISWLMKDYIITVFDKHVSQWIDETAEWIAREIVVEYKFDSGSVNNRMSFIKRQIEDTAEIEVEKIGYKIIGRDNIAIAEGDFGLGEKSCIVIDISVFIDNVLQKLKNKAFAKMIKMIEEGRVTIESEEYSDEWESDEDEFEVEEDLETSLEGTLESYILTIFEKDFRNFITETSEMIAEEIQKSGVSEKDIPYFIKDKISEDIDKFVEEVEGLRVMYVNIVKGRYGRGRRTCKIMPVEEFIDRIYQSTFKQTLSILGGNSGDLFME
jgi:hypothetical protein